MAKGNHEMDRLNKLNSVLDGTRRSSIIEAPTQGDPSDAWEVSTVEQLVTFVQDHPDQFMYMLTTIRNDRDELCEVATWYQELKDIKDALLADKDRLTAENKRLQYALTAANARLPKRKHSKRPDPGPSSHQSQEVVHTPKQDKSTKLPDPPYFGNDDDPICPRPTRSQHPRRLPVVASSANEISYTHASPGDEPYYTSIQDKIRRDKTRQTSNNLESDSQYLYILLSHAKTRTVDTDTRFVSSECISSIFRLRVFSL